MKEQTILGYDRDHWTHTPHPVLWLSRKERRRARKLGWKAEIPATYYYGRILGRWPIAATTMMRPDGTCCGYIRGIKEIRQAIRAQ